MIPGDRILLDPLPGTATENDILRLDSRRGWPPELLDGVLIDRMLGMKGAIVATTLLCRLNSYQDEADLGIVVPASKCPVRLQTGSIRLASAYFISREQMPRRKIPNDTIGDLVPELVVEMLSPWGTRIEMDRKRREFFAAGTKHFWLLDTEEKTVEVYTSERRQLLGLQDNLDGGDLLPGFCVSLAELFDLSQRSRKK